MNRDEQPKPEGKTKEDDNSKKHNLNQNDSEELSIEKDTHRDEWPYLVAYIC